MTEQLNDPMPLLPGYSLRRAATACAAELAERLAPMDLRQSEVGVLILIGVNPGVTAAALGRQLDIQRANMVPLLKRLDEAGLIACKVVTGYRVEECVGLSEQPQGSNLLRAVLAASWQFRVRPPRIGGKEQFGEWVRIQITYSSNRVPR